MKREPCYSFENVFMEARKVHDIEQWVRGNLSHNCAKTILEYCRVLFRRGDHVLARQIAQSQAVKKLVVPGSRQLDDRTYVSAEIPEGCVGRGDYKRFLAELGIGEID
ncbi:hypothetical protein COU80_01550 [Candidatus Peregrinibacteria bacterium CG10_big_fil_rev_8_21_14_0_10_55_24]|nr:MAG: hypothetical protein COU80_01550 [Candidatus Peregrinibacteria bacterium CG10_big_fil_rev_8_21_14_0_10_55_24]